MGGRHLSNLVTGWLERPTARVGLDNLGAQQPCVTIYTHLLPGITNVTDRAAYFGFYPWFIRAFSFRYPNATQSEFRDALRRADCLVTLIAERHAIQCDDPDAGAHGATCPGRQKLSPAAIEISNGSEFRLSDFADRSEENPKRYFKNPLGGLGQYYLGVLRDEHQILIGDSKRGVNYTTEYGDPLADCYSDGLNEALFFDTLIKDVVHKGDLDNLSEFCPCALHGGKRQRAQQALVDLILNDPSSNGAIRSQTFGLILNFIAARGGAESSDMVKDFLTTCYTSSLEPSVQWCLPPSLEVSRRGWALYLRNEMMSLAWSALFKATLDQLNGNPKPLFSAESISGWLLTTPKFSYRPTGGFDALIASDHAEAPALGDFHSLNHEVQFWRELTDGDGSRLVELAVRMLVRLLAREGQEKNSYAALGIPKGALVGYPLTLTSLSHFACTRWRGLTAEEWMRGIVAEVLVAHQRIAIRKLGLSGEDTLMFRCGDEGVYVQRTLEAVVETQPRLRQALQILRDLGVTQQTQPGVLPILTDLGVQQLRAMNS